MNSTPIPVSGCEGCSTTGGIYSCPIHSPNLHIREQPKSFVQLFIRCPWCQKDIQLDGYKLKEKE